MIDEDSTDAAVWDGDGGDYSLPGSPTIIIVIRVMW